MEVRVSKLTEYIAGMFEMDPILRKVRVVGEISNLKYHSSGSVFFTLKDGDAAISCKMWRQYVELLRYELEDGMEVKAFGAVEVYGKYGTYSLIVKDVEVSGEGGLMAAYKALYSRLRDEGIFDPSHKRPLPLFPRKVCVITSGTGAAVQDILKIIKSRNDVVDVLVYPVLVQGENASKEIAAAIQDVNDRSADTDVLIVGRGGGSMEDLWAFNEEIVARAIWRCTIPVISAVGHEPDVTISDFAADVRAATPSNAAELAVRDGDALRSGLRQLQARLEQAEQGRLARLRQRLDTLANSRVMVRPEACLQQRELYLEMLRQRLEHGGQAVLSRQQQRFSRTAAKLDALSPLKVLGRGYAMVAREGAVVRSAAQLKSGDAIAVSLADGTAQCTVETVQRRNKRGKKEDI